MAKVIDVENALVGRKYTVFAGHEHTYCRFERNGMVYYDLATTGGGSGPLTLRCPARNPATHSAVTFTTSG